MFSRLSVLFCKLWLIINGINGKEPILVFMDKQDFSFIDFVCVIVSVVNITNYKLKIIILT